MNLDSFLGIPYKFKGRDRQGIDCLGLVWLYLREKGIFIPDDDGLPMLEESQSDYLDRVLKALARAAEKVAVPQADDIVVMRLPGGYTHMGVMADNQHMLHVLINRPSGLTPIKRYKHHIVAIYRPRRRRGSLLEFMLTLYPPKSQ